MDGIGEAGIWAVRIGTILFIVLAFLLMMERVRVKYAKFVVGKVKCRFITAERNSFVAWLPVEGNTVCLPPKRNLKKGREFAIEDIGCYEIDYPEGWCPKFVRVRAKEALFDLESYEPLSNNSGRPLMPSQLLYNRLREKDTSTAMENAYREGFPLAGSMGGKTSFLLWILVGIGAACATVAAYMTVNYLPDLSEAIQKLIMAAGV